MPDRIAGNPPAAPMPQERICRGCGRTFILRQNEQEVFSARGWDPRFVWNVIGRPENNGRENGSRRRIRDGVRKRRGNKRFFMIV